MILLKPIVNSEMMIDDFENFYFYFKKRGRRRIIKNH